jgi:hypothetical protein
MAQREDPPPTVPPQNYPADKARGGEIILRSRTQRAIFIAGLAGAILLGAVLEVAGWLSR